MNHSSNRSNSSERPCGLTALLPLGMSCRGRAEAFARSLQSRLRTLGTHTNENTPITSDTDSLAENSWLNQNTYTQSSSSVVTNHQPTSARNGLQDVADSYFDFDIPNSPAEEGEYARLIDSNPLATHENAPESGYVCASPISSVDNNSSVAVEHSDSSSTDDPFFDPEGSDPDQRSNSFNSEFFDCDDVKKGANAINIDKVDQHQNSLNGFDSCSSSNSSNSSSGSSSSSTESLPKSQSTTLSTFTANTSESNNTLGNDVDVPDFCASSQPIDCVPIDPTNEEIKTTTTHTKNAVDDDSLPEHNIVDIKLDNTHSISNRNDQPSIGTVPEIPKYDPTNAKSTLPVAKFTNGHSSDNEIDDVDPAPRAERFRRSSSLKTGKTPPGTPGRKKIVRFADVLGLDLADVRTFLDEIPRIPKSAFDELQTAAAPDPEPPISLGQRLDKIIVPLFQQPGLLPHFLDVVQLQNVALESATVTDPICLTISGIVRVRNLDFHKSVHVRYSLDAWQSYSDLQAEYIPNSCDGFSDKFSFIVFGNSMEIGQRIEIALRFSCKGEQFWDNNHGINYCFQCMPATTPQLQTINIVHNDNRHHEIHLHDSWCGTSFY